MCKLKINLKKINKNSKKKTNPPMTALDSRGSYSDSRDYHRHSCRDWWSDRPEVLSSFNMNSDTSELLLFSFTDCENYGKAWPLTHFLKTHFINAAVLQNHTGYIRRVSSAILIHFKFNAQPVTKQKSSGRPRAPSTLPPHEKTLLQNVAAPSHLWAAASPQTRNDLGMLRHKKGNSAGADRDKWARILMVSLGLWAALCSW